MLVQLRYCFEDIQAGAGGTFRIIFVGFGPPEIGHHAIAEIFGDMTVKTIYRFRRSAMIAGSHLTPFLGVELSGNTSRVNQVTKQYRQMPPLAGGRGRGLRDAFSFGRCVAGQDGAAFVAEFRARLVECAARGAPLVQGCSARIAELRPLTIIAVAF